MNEYIINNKVHVKSKNKTNIIINRYFYSLIAFIPLTIIIYLIFGKNILIYQLVRSLLLSFIITSILTYIINIITKDNKLIDIYKKDNVHIISLIIGLFGQNTNIIVLSIAILVTILIKKINKNINLSSILYGLLIITIYKNFNNIITINTLFNIELNKEIIIDYLIGVDYINPILSIIIFIYLFYKKSIKYSIFISYISTIFIITLIIGIFNNMHIVLPFIILASNSIIFLSIYALTDFKATPTINETQIIYGIILGIITIIIMFIIYQLSVIIPMILGPIFLTKYLDNKSYKIKK